MEARITLRVDLETRQLLESEARANDLTISQVVRRLVRRDQQRRARKLTSASGHEDRSAK